MRLNEGKQNQLNFREMTQKQIKDFKLIDVDINDGITFTLLVNKNEIVQHHFQLNEISKIFGGNNSTNEK
jgi:hypothetical protein